jgi:nicotinamide riboside kinase
VKTILITGNCGSGKTWVVKELIKEFNLTQKAKYEKIHFVLNNKIVVLGIYNGEIFEGSDKLSMAVAQDFEGFRKIQEKHNFNVICEGDRFSNSKFINVFNPITIRITDNGEQGRLKRNSKQSEQHLKRIETRVQNINAHYKEKTSQDCLELIKKLIYEKN